MHAFRDVEIAAYCPRKLYYRRQEPDPEETPEKVERRRALAHEYRRLLRDEGRLREAPIAVTPTQFRSSLGCVRAGLECWNELADPAVRNAFVEGRECHGIVHKILDTEPVTLSLVFSGEPPERGVWEPQSVHAVAAAKALAYERGHPVERAVVEYPALGVVRTVTLTTRRKAAYRTALRAAESIDGPPPRLDDDDRCDACEYVEECGVRTRTLRSLL